MKIEIKQTTIKIESHPQSQQPLFKETSISVPVNILKCSTTNRSHNMSHIAKLSKDISENGLKFPIVINEYGVIIEGHHRVEAFKMLGLTEIPANISSILTESDVLQFNNKAKPWTAKDFHEKLDKWVIDIHEEYNIPAQEIELALGIKKGLLKSESVDPTKYPNHRLLVLFIESVWIPIYNAIGKKANRNIFRAIWKICSKLPNVKLDRLINSVIQERDEISRFTQTVQLLKAIASAYNKNLSSNRIMVDGNGTLCINTNKG